jgi:hypothetical protein
MSTKPPLFKIPKSLALCADRLYVVKAARLAKEKEAEAFKAEETALREHLIANLPKSDATGVAGKVCRASITSKTVAQATDWDALYAFIVKGYKKNPGIFALLQKRVGDAAVKEMAEAGVKVPGTELIDVPQVSLNKL